MDLKGYVLMGGVLLLCAVLLHALHAVRRTNRPVSTEGEAAQDFEDPDVDTEAAIALLASDQAAQERMSMTVSMDQSARSEVPQAAADTLPPVDPEPAADATEPSTADHRDAGKRRNSASRVENGRKRLEPRVPRPMRAGLHRRAKPLEPRSAPGRDEVADLEDVIVIWMCAKPGRELRGDRLLAELSASGLLFYSDRVFGKAGRAGSGDWYTVANGVEPGTFDMSEPSALTTPRVALILRLGKVGDPAAAFEDMLDVAGRLAESFGGDLKDERYSDMGVQTVEHCRQRIREYKRTRLRAYERPAEG